MFDLLDNLIAAAAQALEMNPNEVAAIVREEVANG